MIRLSQRRLPRPAAAAGQLRGVRADRRAASPARGQRRRRAPDRRPHARQARGGRRRRRRASPPRSTSGIARQDAASSTALRDRLAARRRRAPAGAARLLRARPATSPPSGSSTRCGWSPPTGTPTSTPGATWPRTSGCSGSTGSPRAEVLDVAGRASTPTSSRATSPTASSSPPPTTCWSRCGSSPSARWVAEYYPVEDDRGGRRRRADRAAAGRGPGLAGPADAPAGGSARAGRPARAGRRTSPSWPRRLCSTTPDDVGGRSTGRPARVRWQMHRPAKRTP